MLGYADRRNMLTLPIGTSERHHQPRNVLEEYITNGPGQACLQHGTRQAIQASHAPKSLSIRIYLKHGACLPPPFQQHLGRLQVVLPQLHQCVPLLLCQLQGRLRRSNQINGTKLGTET